MPYCKTNTQVTRTTHTTQEPPHHRTHEQNTRPNHLAAIGGCATTVRATSHARVGGRAEVSMGSTVEVRRALARARVRRAPAGPSRTCQLEASRGHAGDATPAAAVCGDVSGDSCLRRLGLGSFLPPMLECRRVGSLLEQCVHRCHIVTINRSHAHNTHDKNKDDTGNTKTPKHSHTHTRHTHATTSDNGLAAVVRVVVIAHEIVVGGLTRAAPPRAATWWG